MFQLPAVAPFSVSSEYTTLGQRWEKWVQSLEFYLVASNITDSARKRAVLLHFAGPEVQDIFLTLTDTGVTYETALAKFTEYFTPKKNIPFERHLFRQVSQEPGESIESFATRLQTRAKSCAFENVGEAVRDQIVEKCCSSKLRRRLLREAELTLTSCLQIAKQFQASERHATQNIHPHLKARRLRVLLMHIVYKIHVQGVISNSLLVALFQQSVSVVGWATKPKIRLALQKEKLATNVVNQAILGGCACLH